MPVFITPIAPQSSSSSSSSSSIIWGWYNRPIVATVPSRLSLTPLIIIIKTILVEVYTHPSNSVV
jgi:hypothetical protein